MKTGYRYTMTKLAKPKKQKRDSRNPSTANIAQRYTELQRLRARVFAAEGWRSSR